MDMDGYSRLNVQMFMQRVAKACLPSNMCVTCTLLGYAHTIDTQHASHCVYAMESLLLLMLMLLMLLMLLGCGKNNK